MVIDTAKLRFSTKGLISAVITLGALFEIQPVHDFLIASAIHHPHVSGILGTVTAIAALLHSPEVQDALGVKRTVQVTTEEIALAKEPKL